MTPDLPLVIVRGLLLSALMWWAVLLPAPRVRGRS